ncbi:MAG: hypothetical protein ABS76_07905 [Pelagibacterium sp. SCN 64-44]|nr:MAG: hypothetical protein ABS76_07905 [Pelagibacterium sp. SCN 64-44]
MARRGRPSTVVSDNGTEFTNGSFRDECLNETLFTSLAEARMRIGAWKDDYSDHIPHWTNLTPSQFASNLVLGNLAA